jgi:aspartate/methionine/tyrosine aminotransferase
METLVIKTNSKENLSQLVQYAKELGLEVSVLSDEAYEDIALANAVREGESGEIVDTETFLRDLSSDSRD